MPANVPRDEPLSVGEKEAVQILFDKIRRSFGSGEFDHEGQLLKAVDRAKDMYEEDQRDFDDDRAEAFYHGLLTGYSVAMVLMEQTESEEEIGPDAIG